MAKLDYDQAHRYVEKQQKQGRTVFWDGWTIVSFRPSRSGFFAKNGAFMNGMWGKVVKTSPDSEGIWNI